MRPRLPISAWSKSRRVVAVAAAALLALAAPIAVAATINGTSGNDTLIGTSDADAINAGSGNDHVQARAGDDDVLAGSGNDHVLGEAGLDRLIGVSGNDELDGGDGADTLFGDDGNDTITGGAGNDDALGGSGNDEFDAGTGHDTFDGDSGNDNASGGAGLDVLYADAGNDTLLGGADSDVLVGLSASGKPTLEGGPGRDVLAASRGELVGDDGDDVLFGSGSASISAGAGNDVCYRSSSNVDVSGCEQVLVLGSSSAQASLVLGQAPADGSTLAVSQASFAFSASSAHSVWCVASTGLVARCDSGTFTLSALADGSYAVAIVAMSAGSAPAAVQVRRFDVDIPDVEAQIEGASSSAADTLVVQTRALASAQRIRARFADGGSASWLVTDPRVAIDPPLGFGASTITITDPNLGAETVTRVEALDASGAVTASRDVSVAIESLVQLSTAASNAASSLTITGSGLDIVDRVVLLHDGGSLSVLMSDPGVVRSAGQIQITGAALGGLRVSQIDAVLAVDGLEVVDSLQVDITIAQADTTPPAITTPADITVEATSASGAPATFVVTAVDAVDGSVAITCDHASGSTFALGDTTVVCTATDAAGNAATEQFSITVVDTTAPQLTLPATISVDAPDAQGALVSFDTTAIDVVDGATLVTCSPTSGARFVVGTTIVICSSADSRANAATSSFFVVVRDVTGPVLALTSPSTVDVDSPDGGEANFTVTAEDDIDGTLPITCTPASGSMLEVGEHAIHCTATDGAGNIGELDFTLTIRFVDTTAPVITTPGDLTQEATSAQGAVVSFLVGAVDAVDGSVAASCDWASGATFALGNTTVTCTATDVAGNASTASFVVNVVDSTGPVLNLPSPITVDAQSPAGAILSYSAEAVDAVDGSTVVGCVPTSGSTFVVGATTVVCSSTDARSNTSTGSFQVLVRDVTAPVLELVSGSTVRVDDAQGASVDFDVTAADDVDGNIAVTCDPASGSSLTPGSYAVHCTATDLSGNTGVLDFTLTVELVDAYTRADDLITESHPTVFEEGYEPNLPMGVERSMPDAETILMDTADPSGEIHHIVGKGLFGFVDSLGALQRINTALIEAGDGFRPASVPYEAVLPKTYSDGIRWTLAGGRGEIRVRALDTNPAAPNGVTVHGDDHVLYPSVWPRTDVVATAFENGVKEHLIAASAAAPSEYSWVVEHPAGSTLSIEDGEAVLTFGDGSTQSVSRAPFANDAAGNGVGVWYEVSSGPDGDILTMAWEAQTLSELGGGAVNWPVDLDPNIQAAAGVPVTEIKLGTTTPDGMGIQAVCTTSDFDLQFRGRTYANATKRRFLGGLDGARSNCGVDGPPVGFEWFRFIANLDWRVNSNQRIILRDQALASPIDSDARDLSEYQYTTSSAVTARAARTVDWSEVGPVHDTPTGDVRLFFTNADNSDQATGDNRKAHLGNIRRYFADDEAPVVIAVAPAVDDQVLSAGSHAVGISGFDAGIGCKSGTIVITPDNGLPVTTIPFSGCTYTPVMMPFMQPGTYEITYSIQDQFDTVNDDETRTITIADPIASPTGETPVGGVVTAELEIADDLPAGSVQLYAILPAGQQLPVGSEIVISSSGVADNTVERAWDTRANLNGAYKLRLVLTPNVGAARVLEEVIVTVANVDPLAGLGNASTSSVGVGLSVVHKTGALEGTFDVVKQPGFGGIEFGISRTYNSLNDRTGLFGEGWSSSLEQRIEFGLDGRATFVDELGHRWVFTPDGASGFTPAPGQTGVLSAAMAGPDAWIMRHPNGHELHFAPPGGGVSRLVRETWRAGNSVLYAGPQTDLAGFTTYTVSDSAPAPHVVTARVSPFGRIVSVTDSENRATVFTYDGLLRLSQVTDRAGGVLTYSYEDESARLIDLQDQVGKHWGFAYDANATPAEVDQPRMEVASSPALPDGAVAEQTFDYDSTPNQVAESASPAGSNESRDTLYSIDALGQAESVENDAGDKALYTYNLMGQIRTATDENGAMTETRYDAVGHVIEEVDGELNSTKYFGLDQYGVPTSLVDAAGQTTTQVLDASGNVLERTGPDLKTWTYTYVAGTDLKASEENPLGDVTQYGYSSTGQLASEAWIEQGVDNNPDVTHYRTRSTFDNSGRMLTTRVGQLPASTMSYDGEGRLTEAVDAMQVSALQTWDPAGRLKTSTDKLGRPTTNTYDAMGNLIQTNAPGGVVTKYEFNVFGEQTATVDPENRRSKTTYDNVGNVHSEIDSNQEVTQYGYDKVGNQTSETDPLLHTITTEYDKNGNEKLVTQHDGSFVATSYTPLGGVDVESDQDGLVADRDYDVMGRETSVRDVRGNAPSKEYDDAGRLKADLDASGIRTEYGYDAGGRKTLTIRPDLTVQSMVYDDAGRVKSTVDARGGITMFEYDALGRELSQIRPDLSTWSKTYDAEGKVLTSTNGAGETTITTYDAQGRVETITTPGGAVTSKTYFDDGQPRTVTTSPGGTRTFTYDQAGRKETVTDEAGAVTTFGYDDAGNLTSQETGGDVRTFAYDERNQKSSVVRGASRHDYAYDGRGRQTRHSIRTDGMNYNKTYDESSNTAYTTRSLDWSGYVQSDWRDIPVQRTTSRLTQYTALDNMGRVFQRSETWPEIRATFFTYDAEGSVTTAEEQVGPNFDVVGTRSWNRDVSGRAYRYQSLAGYDAEPAYDGAGRVTDTTVDELDGSSVQRSRHYDAAGRVDELDTGHGLVTYTYTPDDLVETKALPGGRSISYTYDAKRRLASEQMSGENAKLYTYDELDRITVIREAATVTGLSWVVDRYAYDSTGRLQYWWHDQDRIKTEYVYDYGLLRMIQRTIEVDVPGANTELQDQEIEACQYDITGSGPHPFTGVTCPAELREAIQQRFGTPIPHVGVVENATGVDAQLARYMRTRPLLMKRFNIYYDEDENNNYELTYIPTAVNDLTKQRYSFDPSTGTQIGFDSPSYFMRSLTDLEGTSEQFTYDPHERVKERVGANRIDHFTYSNDGHMIRIDYSDGSPSKVLDWDEQDRLARVDVQGTSEGDLDLVYDDQGLLAIHEGGSVSRNLYPIYNHRGDITAYTDDSGQIVSSLAYSPHGEREATGDSTWGENAIFGYQGRYTSISTTPDDIWMGSRTYKPSLNMFQQVDPEEAQEATGDTAYSYAANDPVNRVDPNGMRAVSINCNVSMAGVTPREWVGDTGPKYFDVKADVSCTGSTQYLIYVFVTHRLGTHSKMMSTTAPTSAYNGTLAPPGEVSSKRWNSLDHTATFNRPPMIDVDNAHVRHSCYYWYKQGIKDAHLRYYSKLVRFNGVWVPTRPRTKKLKGTNVWANWQSECAVRLG